jgi:hypothetical protein
MSNQIKLAAIAILIIVIGSGSLFISGVFKPKKGDQLVVNSSSISSVSNSVVSTNSASMISSTQISNLFSSSSFSSKSNLVSSSSSQIQSSSKAVESVNPTNLNGIQIEYLNSKNSPQYIQDYLACETKDIKDIKGKITHYGRFANHSNQLKYFCPPSLASANCKHSITYIDNVSSSIGFINSSGFYTSPYKNGWNCDLWNPVNYLAGFGDPCTGNVSERNLELEGYFPERISNDTCMFYFPEESTYNSQKVSQKASQILRIITNQGGSLKKILILK